MYIYIYIFVWWPQSMGTGRDPRSAPGPTIIIMIITISSSTVGFHNFNLRNFNLRVSNTNKLIVDVFVDTMSDFNVPGSRPRKTR